ncbi:unnamed protein product, partial [Cylicostephanus goldi]
MVKKDAAIPESLGSVRERIARFESLQDEKPTKSSPDKGSVDIVVTPVSPMPAMKIETEDIAQEPLSPSIESEVSQAEVKSSSSYSGDEHSPRGFERPDSREKRAFVEEPRTKVPSPPVEEVKEQESEKVDEYLTYPKTVIEMTREEMLELEERSESPQLAGVPKKQKDDDQYEVISPIPIQDEPPEEHPKLAETRTTPISSFHEVQEQQAMQTEGVVPPSEQAEAPPKYEDVVEELAYPKEEHEYRTVKKTVTTVTTTRYMEMPESAEGIVEQAEEPSPYPTPREPLEEVEYPTMTKTVTTVTTTIEVPETPESEKQEHEVPEKNLEYGDERRYDEIGTVETEPYSALLTGQEPTDLAHDERIHLDTAPEITEIEYSLPTTDSDFSTAPKTVTTTMRTPYEMVADPTRPDDKDSTAVRKTVTTVTTTFPTEGITSAAMRDQEEFQNAPESPDKPVSQEKYPYVSEATLNVMSASEEYETTPAIREQPDEETKGYSVETGDEFAPATERFTTVITKRIGEEPATKPDFENYSPLKRTVISTRIGEPEIEESRSYERESPKLVETPVHAAQELPTSDVSTTATSTHFGEHEMDIEGFGREPRSFYEVTTPVAREDYSHGGVITTVTTTLHEEPESQDIQGPLKDSYFEDAPRSPTEPYQPMGKVITTVATTLHKEEPEQTPAGKESPESPISSKSGIKHSPIKETVTITMTRYEDEGGTPEHYEKQEYVKTSDLPEDRTSRGDYQPYEETTTITTTTYEEGEVPESLGTVEDAGKQADILTSTVYQQPSEITATTIRMTSHEEGEPEHEKYAREFKASRRVEPEYSGEYDMHLDSTKERVPGTMITREELSFQKTFKGDAPDRDHAPKSELISDEGQTGPPFDDTPGLATKASKIAAGALIAPVALAAMGASAAYEALAKDDEEKRK